MKEKIPLIVCFVLAWLAFWTVGALIFYFSDGKEVNAFGWIPFIGYDNFGFLPKYCDLTKMFNLVFRHPIEKLMYFPMFLIGSSFAEKCGASVAGVMVLGCFAFMGAVCVLLLYFMFKRLRVTGLQMFSSFLLWFSFGHVWVLGGIAESFGTSMMILLIVLLMVAHEVTDYRAWLAVTVASGGVTITNLVKPFAAWIISVPRNILRTHPFGTIFRISAEIVIVGVLLLCAKWIYVDRMGIDGGLESLIHDVTDFLPDGKLATTAHGRLWYFWNAFLCEPMMFHGELYGVNVVDGYKGVLPHIAAVGIYALCIWSAIVNFSRPLVRVLLAMISFDIVLHVIIGWGIYEGQIYCGHWFFAIPVLIGLLPNRYSLLSVPFALFIACHNLMILFR